MAGALFWFLGCAVGFSALITALINCYFINPVGLWSIKLVMGPFLLLYIINSFLLAYYLSHMFAYYLPDSWVRWMAIFALSIAVAATASKLWNAYRLSALCIRFSECREEDGWVIKGMNSVTDSACGEVDPLYTNDACRRWIAQIPLILLALMSVVILHYVRKIWDDKFGGGSSSTAGAGSNSEASKETQKASNPDGTAGAAAGATAAADTTRTGAQCACSCHKSGQKKEKPCLVSLGSVIRNALR